MLIDDQSCEEDVSPASGESSGGGFSHPTDDDQEGNDECANLLQVTSQWPNLNLAEYRYDRAADADTNGEFHIALETLLAKPVM